MRRSLSKVVSRLGLALGAVVFVGACHFTGPSAGSFTPAVSGHGVNTQLRLGGRRIEGELLQIRDTAYVLMAVEGILIVPFAAVDKAQFENLGSIGRGAPDPEWRDRLQLASRFPDGMSDDALEQLLACTKQSGPHYIR